MIKTYYLSCAKCKAEKLTQVSELSELPAMPYEWYKVKNLFERYDVYFCEECKVLYRIKKKWYRIKKTWAFIKSMFIEEA